MTTDVQYTESSGNVYADMGMARHEERSLKSQLAMEIRKLIERKRWTQARLGREVGLDPPQLSNLLRGRLSGFSVEALFSILNRLGHDIEVHISSEARVPHETRTVVVVG